MNIKKFYSILFFVLITGLILSVNFKSSDIFGNDRFTGGPKISFAEKQRDFGKIVQGDIIQYEFDFSNDGDENLEITNVQTSCGCTAAVVEGSVLKPSESGSIKVGFDSTGREGRTSKTIVVMSNDPENPAVTLTIYAEIERKTEQSK